MNEKLLERLKFHNPWWQTGKVSPKLSLPYKRRVFREILHWLSKLERIFILKGPRRTGKSTILYQLIAHFMDKGVKPENLFYLAFDDPDLRIPLEEIFSVYEKGRARDLGSLPKTFIFLDEVQFLGQWELAVKLIFDKKLPVVFFVSGSSSSLIIKGSESLAGRTIEKILLPFSFPEFAEKEYGEKTIRAAGLARNKKQLAIAWERYLREGGFPQLMNLTIEEKREVLKTDIIDKVIYKDLTQLYNIKDASSLEKLFRFLIENTAGILNISQLGGFLGLSRETVENYLFYLKQAYLIFTLPKFSHSSKEIIRSLEKVHLIDQSFSLIFPEPREEAVLESVIARHIWEKYQRGCYYWRDKYEVDLVFEEQGRLKALEVKKGDEVPLKSLRGLINFCKKYKLKEGGVIYSGERKEKKIEGIKISFMSFYEYLLGLK